MALTLRQRAMVCESEPSQLGGSCGAELWTPQDYAVARSLKAKGLGSWERGPKGNCGLYFNNEDGLQLRADILGIEPEDDDWDEA
jgi:hypothetical protein